MGLSGKEFLIRDLLIDDQYGVVKSTATVQDAAKKMKELGVPDLVVVEEGTEKVLGVIADFDIVQNAVAEGTDCSSAKVISTMYTIDPVNLNTPVSVAFTRMQNLRVNVVPVVENGKLVGVASIQDCWSYIPDMIPDERGLIPVSNTRVAEFWFASIAAVTAFILGILFPLAGVFGFFIADQADVMTVLGLADVRGGLLFFYLFEAHGTDFFVPILSLIEQGGAIWGAIIAISTLLLIFGIVGLLALIYTSFADTKNIHTGRMVRFFLPSVVVLLLVLEWIFFAIGFAVSSVPVVVGVDPVGLTMSILSMILVILAINRDYIFKEKGLIESEKPEVK
ncbi:MAG: CBS domain-containing protein [Promethearchaeota archaeon]|nr:MAG: CBS domain-containing protein [Candidatus Lokiarchaeota archaeon]